MELSPALRALFGKQPWTASALTWRVEPACPQSFQYTRSLTPKLDKSGECLCFLSVTVPVVSKALIGELGTPKVETSALVRVRATFSKSNVCNCVTPKWVWDLRV